MLALVASPCIAQEDAPSPALQAARDCLAATSRFSVSDKVILDRGWKPAKIRGAGAQASPSDELRVKGYGKADGHPAILVDVGEATKPRKCRVVGNYADDQAHKDLVLEFTNEFGPPIIAEDNGGVGFQSGLKIIALGANENSFAIEIQELGE